MSVMVGPGQPPSSTRHVLVVLVSLLLATATVAACGPPKPRVHLGPVPIQLFSWEMGRNLPVYAGIDDATLALGGVGWDTESAALDEPGQIVLFGHRVSHDGPLRTIHLLRPGHTITIVGANGRSYRYVVVSTRVTAPDWNQILAWTPSNGRGLTLVACHPPGSVQYRIVVHAELI